LQHTAVIPYAGTNITNDIRQGLGVLRAQAEAMKVQFGMALADEAKTNAYITIPGLRGLPPKEISVKNLAHIIQARTEEILDYVMYHLKQISLDKKLFGGIILTGGGSQLNHLIQLTEFKTGMGARIGQPNEHLAGGHHESLNHPMYATCIGLILRGYSDFETGRLNFNSTNKEVSVHKDALTSDVVVKVEVARETPVSQPAAFSEPEPDMDDTEQAREKMERNNKRSDTIKKVIYQIKSGFMSLFEEPGDQQI